MTKLKNAKLITFFNHKGGVGKTTLVHNLGFALADRGYKVLLIDADPQMNLTAAMYGLSTSVEYSVDEESKWSQNVKKYISLTEYLAIELKGRKCAKKIFRAKGDNKKGFVDLISGSIDLFDIEVDMYGIIKNRNEFTDEIPYKFEKSIRKKQAQYDFILIDTSPSASSIVNALLMMITDYFITPVSPSFFSLQAIDNLSQIFANWMKLLNPYQTTRSFKGLSFQPKFLGLVVQMAKRFNAGTGKTSFSKSTEKWVKDVNVSVKKFHKFSTNHGMAISEVEFEKIFGKCVAVDDPSPFVIQKCCDFTLHLRSIAEKAGVPVIHLTQKICDKYKDSNAVDLRKKDGQYARALASITQSYGKIADGLVRL